MHNVDYKVTGDKLVITIDIGKSAVEEAEPSASGKTYLVSTTAGAVPLETKHCKKLSLALNVMAKR